MPPPRRSYATPEETFGIAKKPLNDWFDFAASGLERTGPAFSADLEDADFRNQQRELEREKLRQQMDSEQAASAFMKRAAGQSPTGLMQMIAEDPAILSSSGYGNIQDYVNMRSQLEQQKLAEQPFSNKTLAPALMKSMKPADQLRFQKYLGEGLDTVTAFDRMEQEDATRARQEKYRASSLGLIEEGADPAAVDAAIASPDPDRAFALIKRDLRKATGKTGSGELSLADIIKLKKENINDYGEVIDADVATYLDTQLKQAIAPKKTINPSTGAVITQGDFDIAAEQAKLDAARKEDTAVQDVAAPVKSAFIPATAYEERQLAAQQQRAVAESQKQQLADVTWAGLKGTAAAQGADAGGPADLVAEARRAIVGGETTSKRAQRIAALARASVEGRDVSIGTRQGVGMGGMAGTGLETQDIRVSPAEALVRELGFKPDAIVGQAPSRAGGPLRDVTALQAAQAILADAADPYIKLTQGQQAQAKAAQMSDKVAKGLESISGTGNTQK
jgi:hypothetical protein